MQSINFDKGYKTYAVNGDENNVIKINVGDHNLRARMKELPVRLSVIEDKYKNIENITEEQCVEADKAVRAEMNYAFGTDIATPVFGSLNCLTVLPDSGKSVAQSFLEALMPIIKNDVDEYVEKIQNLKKSKVTQYLEPITPAVEKIDIEKLSPEEKDRILSEVFT